MHSKNNIALTHRRVQHEGGDRGEAQHKQPVQECVQRLGIRHLR